MADLSDVETVLAALVTSAIYPQGTNAPSALGSLVKIYRGWPNQTALNSDLAAGTINVTIYPDPAQHRMTTRYLDPPTAEAPILPTLTASVSAQSVTFAGVASIGQIAGILVDNAAFVHRTAVGDTPELVAAIIATYVRTQRIAQVSGATITIPGAGSLIARVVADQQSLTETRRQVQGFRLTSWCPTPTSRDQTAILIDQALSQQTFLTLPDTSKARLQETNTLVFDQSQNANLYRRDLLVAVEYPTTIAATLPAVIFGDSRILPNGTETQSLLG
jgi:hypothetical protein